MTELNIQPDLSIGNRVAIYDKYLKNDIDSKTSLEILNFYGLKSNDF